ncbi:conjugal transfer protein [Pantoea agglomerans]|uniref:conjugal transfer protein n=1 Tax=Enterobacter agglomerans TaxID=549 RepID=UPI0032086C06
MNGAHFHTRAASAPLFTLPLAGMPWFVMHGDGLYAQNAHDALAPLYRGEDAAQLLECITNALRNTSKRRRRRERGLLIAAVLLAASAAVSVSFLFPHYSERPQFQVGPVNLAPPAPVASSPVRNEAPMAEQGAVPADNWSLPASARLTLPAKLRSAASRGIFTIPLSSGHARTLYVFADPLCANCQRMERHFETAAGMVNVVIFPVTIEGRNASLQTLTPVMLLPEAERAAAWKHLFSADAGMPVPGRTQDTAPASDKEKTELAQGAIGVNEVAYRAYRLPGTPWTISDDGRYVPQAVLSSPASLEAFLKEGAADGQ